MRIRAPWGETLDIEPSAEAIWRVLEEGVRYQLRTRGTPPDPYRSEVAYRREPMRNGRRRDHYQPWWEVRLQRHGDCEDLAMWRALYLRNTGQDPGARVALIEWAAGGWHAVVFRTTAPLSWSREHYRVADLGTIYGPDTHVYAGPDIGWDPAGVIEDPSQRLGMWDSARGGYSPLASGLQREPRGPLVASLDPYLPFELGAPSQRLSPREIATVAERAGFQGEQLVTAVAVALEESGGDPRREVIEVQPRGARRFRGLWQISAVWPLEQPFDPDANAGMAFRIWRSQGFQPWGAFSSGRYRRHLATARQAVAQLEETGVSWDDVRRLFGLY